MDSFTVDDIISDYSDIIELSRGGQKIVFKATDSIYGNLVVKIGKCNTLEGMQRIEQEVNILKTIKSDYFPQQFGFHKYSNFRFAMIEEYINGQTLSITMEKYFERKHAFSLIKELFNGLKILWKNNIVHRDIKPDNIIILQDGSIKIIDLGIARLLGEESITNTLLPNGPCTPNYSSPEQLLNNKSAINWRSDQFCLGILLFQLLLKGIHPFNPKNVGIGEYIYENIINNKHCDFSLIENVTSNEIKLLDKMLGNQPYQRYRKPSLLLLEIERQLEEIK